MRGDNRSEQGNQNGADCQQYQQSHSRYTDKTDCFFVVKVPIEKASKQFAHELSAFSDPVVVRNVIFGKVQNGVPTLLNKHMKVSLRTRVRGDNLENLLGL